MTGAHAAVVDTLIAAVTQRLRAGAIADAIALVESAPAAQRNTPAAQRMLAAAYAQDGQLAAAQAAIQRALATSPVEPATRAMAGRIAFDQQQFAAAFTHFEALVQLAPQQIGFWRYLFDAATTPATARRAIQLAQTFRLDLSSDVSVAWNATRTLVDNAQIDQALALAEQTVRRYPDDTAAQWLWVKRLTDEAPLRAAHALQRVPLAAGAAPDADRVDALLTVPEQYVDEAQVSWWRSRCADGLRELATHLVTLPLTDEERLTWVRHTAFRLAYHGRDDLSLQCARGDLLCALMAPITPARRAPGVGSHAGAATRLRVGFVSRHIRDCTVGQYFKRFLTGLRDERIAVNVYACGQRDGFTDEVAANVDCMRHFTDEATVTSVAAAIAADAPEVLIYPEIGMEPLIEKLAAMRLAPRQCALWGHPVTSGLPTIDVYLSAAALEPANASSHYRERLHLLPGLGTSYPTPPSPSSLDRAALGLPPDGPLVVCAQSAFKWSPAFTRAVVDILRRDDALHLVVFDSPVSKRSRVFDDYLQHFFSAASVDGQTRVVRLPSRGRADFLAVLQHCELALDTFGFSGGNTSLDALSAGLPIVTLPGEFMRGRQTLAMLRTLQSPLCDELIARDPDDFVDRVLRLMQDAAARGRLREAIRANVHRLFNDPEPVATLRDWLLAQANA